MVVNAKSQEREIIDELELKPDGSTYLALLVSCVAAPSGAEEIKEVFCGIYRHGYMERVK